MVYTETTRKRESEVEDHESWFLVEIWISPLELSGKIMTIFVKILILITSVIRIW